MLTGLRIKLQAAIQKSLSEFSPSLSPQPEIVLEIPAEKIHGELSTNVAMRLTKILKKDPVSIANGLCQLVEKNIAGGPLKEKIRSVEVKKPGFINFFLTESAFYDILEEALKSGKDYGRLKEGKGKKIQLEFVSANPTGPLSVAHARQAAVGDALSNILKFAGYDATKEF